MSGQVLVEPSGKKKLIAILSYSATKYTTSYKGYELGKNSHSVNYFGNHRRSMHISVRDSLAKLQTDWIDLLYLHWWDFSSSIPEIMDSLHMLVEQGKVLYLGISDTPAWLVSAANEYAMARGKTPFSVYQGRWNLMVRDFERDIIPMARHYGMALAPWDVLGGGKFQTQKQLEKRKKDGEGLRKMMGVEEQTEQERKISEALEVVAKEVSSAFFSLLKSVGCLMKEDHANTLCDSTTSNPSPPSRWPTCCPRRRTCSPSWVGGRWST